MNKKDDVKAFKAPSPVLILVCVIVLCALPFRSSPRSFRWDCEAVLIRCL